MILELALCSPLNRLLTAGNQAHQVKQAQKKKLNIPTAVVIPQRFGMLSDDRQIQTTKKALKCGRGKIHPVYMWLYHLTALMVILLWDHIHIRCSINSIILQHGIIQLRVNNKNKQCGGMDTHFIAVYWHKSRIDINPCDILHKTRSLCTTDTTLYEGHWHDDLWIHSQHVILHS